MDLMARTSCQSHTVPSAWGEVVPMVLQNRSQWVVWKLMHRDGQAKATKVPYNPRKENSKASTTNPDTWSTFQDAVSACRSGPFDGIGFVFSTDDPYVGIDLDGCRDPETGVVQSWARDIIDLLQSYTEISPSGSGVHILVEGGLPPERRRRGHIEMYSEDRFFTVTGNQLPDCPMNIERRSEELLQLHAKVFREDKETLGNGSRADKVDRASILDDDTLITEACKARNGEKFQALWDGDWSSYNSESEATLALCDLLAFWTNGDAGRIDRLFRRSGLMRPK